MIGFKDHAIPLYYQLENILREKIKSGEYGPGGALPTEDELANSYKVSRITVRQALSALKKDQLIYRRRGKGSFVTEGLIHLEPMKLTGMMDDIIAMGIRTKTKVIYFNFIQPSKKVAESLNISEDAKVLRVERVRLINGSPFSYNVSYIPYDLGQKINIKDLAHQPLLNLLENKCKVKIVRGVQIVEATLADSRVASFLDVMTGAPLLKIDRIVFDNNKRPVEYITILYRSDRYNYSVELIRKGPQSRNKWGFKPLKRS